MMYVIQGRTSTREVSLENDPSYSLNLMDLPPEIRNRIYLFVLGPRDHRTTQRAVISASKMAQRRRTLQRQYLVKDMEIYHTQSYIRSFQFPTERTLSILLVCKQIYAEAFHVYYSSNCFYIPDTALLFSFLKGIGYNRRQHLTMIAFDWRGAYAKEAFRLLKTCRMLRTISLTLPCSKPPGYAAIREIRGLERVSVEVRIHYSQSILNTLHRSIVEGYDCSCGGRQSGKGRFDHIHELESAMKRPRLKQYALDPNEEFDLFKRRLESFKATEGSLLCDINGSRFAEIGEDCSPSID